MLYLLLNNKFVSCLMHNSSIICNKSSTGSISTLDCRHSSWGSSLYCDTGTVCVGNIAIRFSRWWWWWWRWGWRWWWFGFRMMVMTRFRWWWWWWVVNLMMVSRFRWWCMVCLVVMVGSGFGSMVVSVEFPRWRRWWWWGWGASKEVIIISIVSKELSICFSLCHITWLCIHLGKSFLKQDTYQYWNLLKENECLTFFQNSIKCLPEFLPSPQLLLLHFLECKDYMWSVAARISYKISMMKLHHCSSLYSGPAPQITNKPISMWCYQDIRRVTRVLSWRHGCHHNLHFSYRTRTKTLSKLREGFIRKKKKFRIFWTLVRSPPPPKS